MHCPACKHKRTRVLRTRPDAEFPARDLVRQCRNPACGTIFTCREALVSVMEAPQDREVVKEMAARIEALPESAREALFNLVSR